jgi:hypothetical protein
VIGAKRKDRQRVVFKCPKVSGTVPLVGLNEQLKDLKEIKMDEAKSAFEALMVTKQKSVSDLWDGKAYTNKNIHTKWSYFLMGWTMAKQGK